MLHHAYQGFIFLAEDILLLPNLVDKRLEIYTLSDIGLVPKCFLNLPLLLPQHIILMLTCRAEPNPVGKRSDVHGIHTRDSTNPPFVSSPENAIAIFNMTVIIGQAMEFNYFSFIVHRSALLKWFLKCLEPSISAISASEHIFGSYHPEIPISPPSIPWHEWGPPVTRWFSVLDVAHGYITTTAG
jgi:hypothetical protein